MILQVKRKNWLIVLNAIIVNFLLGSVYSWSEIKLLFIKQYGWNLGNIKPPFTLLTISFVIATVIGGIIQDKSKPKLVFLTGSLLYGLGFILSGFYPYYDKILITFGVICGTGMGLCFSTTIPSAVNNSNPKRTGIIIGLIVSGLGMAPLYMDFFTNLLLDNYSVKYTFIILGLTCMALLMTLSLSIKPYQCYENYNQKNDHLKNNINRSPIFKSRFFQALWIIQLLSTFGSLIVIGYLGSVAHAQISWDTGFTMVVIISISNFTGRILGGFLFDYLGFRKLLLSILLLQVVNIMMFWSYKNIPLMVMGSSITGFTYGALFTFFPAAVFNKFGGSEFGKNFGILFTGWGIAVILNSFLFRKFVIPVGTLNIPHILALVFFFISLYMLRFLKEPKKI